MTADRLVAYVPSFSFQPGDVVPVHLAGNGGDTSVRLVRLDRLDEPEDVLGHEFSLDGPAAPHHFPLGSYGQTEAVLDLRPTYRLSLSVRITRWPETAVGVVGLKSTSGRSWVVEITKDETIRVGVAIPDGQNSWSDPVPAGHTFQRWASITATVAPTEIVISVDGAQAKVCRSAISQTESGTLLLARSPSTLSSLPTTFDGRVASLRIWDDLVNTIGGELDLKPTVEWDMSNDMHSTRIPAIPEGPALQLVNMPTRAVVGPDWDGQCHLWSEDPLQWNAVHFHSDDLEDARWPAAARVPLPTSLQSGVYGINVRNRESADLVPFAVLATPARPRAALRVLLPTFTYLAYANEPVFEPHTPVYSGWWDEYAHRHRLRSLYNWHDDGSGVSLATVHRPLLNMRLDYRYWLTGCAHGLAADLRLLRWLAAKRIDAEVITDHDLDADRHSALDGARVLVTGSHPEYWSRRAMTGLTDFLDSGGRFAYLGGNGLAAMVGIHPERPHVMELRRRSNSPGLWDAEPGELGLATTGELGGYWRHHRPTPRGITGLDSAGMGFRRGAIFRRTAASYSTDAAFVFEGVERDEFGEEADILGTAAAYEVDSADYAHGTPADTLVLATADGFTGYESLEQSGQVRADMTLRITPSGGAVFGVGSISWTSALKDPNISRITNNVLARFIDPRGFS